MKTARLLTLLCWLICAPLLPAQAIPYSRPVETAPQEKPLSIALREINSDLVEFKTIESDN